MNPTMSDVTKHVARLKTKDGKRVTVDECLLRCIPAYPYAVKRSECLTVFLKKYGGDSDSEIVRNSLGRRLDRLVDSKLIQRPKHGYYCKVM